MAYQPDQFVSVVMASRGDVDFIREAVTTVLGQGHRALELILVDYGGGAALDATRRFTDDRITRLQAPAGSTKPDALNIGLATAKGDVFAVIDGDDLWKPGKLQAQLQYLNECPEIGVLGTQVERFGAWGGPSMATRFPEAPGDVRRSLQKGVMPVQQSSMIVRSDVLGKLHGYKPECVRCEDLELLLRAVNVTQIANLADVYTSYRVAKPGQSWKYWKSNEEWRKLAILVASGASVRGVSPWRRWWWREISVLRLLPYYLVARWRDGGFP